MCELITLVGTENHSNVIYVFMSLYIYIHKMHVYYIYIYIYYQYVNICIYIYIYISYEYMICVQKPNWVGHARFSSPRGRRGMGTDVMSHSCVA